MEELIGNEGVKAQIEQLLASGRTGNALLFCGPLGVGKFHFAKGLAKRVLADEGKVDRGQHPDFHLYRPEGRAALHPIERMRELATEVFLPPNEAPRKVFLIDDADRMATFAANALLKTLEEPALDALIILVSSEPERLLPTICSRCRALRFQSLSQAEVERFLKSAGFAADLAPLARGSLWHAENLAKGQADLRTKCLRLLELNVRVAYGELREEVKQLSDALEELRTWDAKGIGKDSQVDAIKGQREGEAILRYLRTIDWLFFELVMWYRDQYVTSLNVGASLYHPDRKYSGVASPPALKTLTRAIMQAREAIARFSKAATVFEALFLRLLKT